jgi:hypothetical protein
LAAAHQALGTAIARSCARGRPKAAPGPTPPARVAALAREVRMAAAFGSGDPERPPKGSGIRALYE